MRPAYSGFGRGAFTNPVVLGRKYCPTCGRWRQVNDFAATKGGAGVVSKCRVCQYRYNKMMHARRSEEQIELRREYHRIWQEGRRRRLGIPRRALSREAPRSKNARRLPVGPIASILREADLAAIANLSGVPDRTLRRIVTGEFSKLNLDLVDRLCMAVDIPLPILYPEDQ